MRASTALILALAAGLVGCNSSASPKVDTAKEEAAIRATEKGWMEAYNKHDANALAGQYDDDGAIANPGVAVATHASARRAMVDAAAADPALKVDFASDRITVANSGELAASRGHYTMTFTDPETKKPKTESGSYLTVYRKAGDGSWKALEDVITPGPAPAAPAQ
jgi:uncharacterized protein (TIGR02246 family)